MNYKNAFFQLLTKNDGIYIKVYPALNNGQNLKIEEIMDYLTMKNIKEYDLKAVHMMINNAKTPTEAKICDGTILPENESVAFRIEEDNMSVVGRFYPPSTKGNLLGLREIESEMARAGIKYGILHQNIEVYLRHRQFCTDVLLAKGKESIQGTSAIITYNFNLDVNMKPQINQDGSVDFHHLDMINRVTKGDVLATLKPADFGITGVDVYGREIRPLKVQNRVLKHGRNIHLSEDGLTMYSDVSGHVSLTDDKVFVSDTYEVNGDVDASTGDIEYDGNVTVKGNVITGFKVKAKGDIIVSGVVEGAIIEAEGQIILNRGMQGMNRGELKAGGNIFSKFFENATITAGGNIETDAIMHSKVYARGDVIVNGKRGLITGGEIKSASLIVVKTVGSTMGTSTLLEVGIDPSILEEYRQLERSIPKWQAEKDRIEQSINMFKTKLSRGDNIPPDKLLFIKSAGNTYKKLENQIDKAKQRCIELQIDMDNYNGGCVSVSNIAYSGVKMVISNVMYYVRGNVHHSKFIRDGADIKVIGLM